jgi:hypothetical protein
MASNIQVGLLIVTFMMSVLSCMLRGEERLRNVGLTYLLILKLLMVKTYSLNVVPHNVVINNIIHEV